MTSDLHIIEPVNPSDLWLVTQVVGNGWRAVHTIQPIGRGQAMFAGYRVEPEVPPHPPTARQQRGIATGDAVLRAVLCRMQSSG